MHLQFGVWLRDDQSSWFSLPLGVFLKPALLFFLLTGSFQLDKPISWFNSWASGLSPHLHGDSLICSVQTWLSRALRGGVPDACNPHPTMVPLFPWSPHNLLVFGCGTVWTVHLVCTKYNNFSIYLKSHWMYSFIYFLLDFSCSLFISILWVALSVLSF